METQEFYFGFGPEFPKTRELIHLLRQESTELKWTTGLGGTFGPFFLVLGDAADVEEADDGVSSSLEPGNVLNLFGEIREFVSQMGPEFARRFEEWSNEVLEQRRLFLEEITRTQAEQLSSLG